MMFEEVLKKRALQNIYKDIDFGIMITGTRGFGKSTLAFHIAWQCQGAFAEKGISSEIYFIRGTLEEHKALLEKLEEFADDETKIPIVIFDEARLFIDKRRAMSIKNIVTVQLFTILRPLHGVYIFVAPEPKDIDKDFRNPDKMHWFIYLWKRGHGALWVDEMPAEFFKMTSTYIFTRWERLLDYFRHKGKSFLNLINVGVKRYDPTRGKYYYYKPIVPFMLFKFYPPFKVPFYIYENGRWTVLTYDDYREIRRNLVKTAIQDHKRMLETLLGKYQKGKKNL